MSDKTREAEEPVEEEEGDKAARRGAADQACMAVSVLQRERESGRVARHLLEGDLDTDPGPPSIPESIRPHAHLHTTHLLTHLSTYSSSWQTDTSLQPTQRHDL